MSNKKEYLLNLSPKSIASSRISNMYACMQSHFSWVQICVPRRTAACQAPLSMGLSRQEHMATHSSPTQGTNPSLLHLTCTGRRVLYHQHHWGTPGSLTWSNTILGVEKASNKAWLHHFKHCCKFPKFLSDKTSSLFLGHMIKHGLLYFSQN